LTDEELTWEAEFGVGGKKRKNRELGCEVCVDTISQVTDRWSN
jgi:hypothetical protein